MQTLQYPIGRFELDADATDEKRRVWIDRIDELPVDLRAAVDGLSDAQLDTRYRPEGWTVRQVVHHVADSHLNAYVRMKLAMTEESPTIRPYDEARWAELEEARTAPVAVSLALLDTLHRRWVLFLRTLRKPDFARTLYHPEMEKTLTLDYMLQLYAWHCHHHVAHITSLRERKGWD